MNDTINNGGPAFPEIRIRGGDNYNQPMKIYYGGMTLRDYFAAKAMLGLLAKGVADEIIRESDMDWPDAIAGDSYAMADAMLKARGQ